MAIPTAEEMHKAIKDNFIISIQENIADDCQIIIDDAILADSIAMWEREIMTAKSIHKVNPSDYRIAGYLAFWIRKLKPFSLSPHDLIKQKRYKLQLIINELVAIQLGLFMLYSSEERNDKKLSSSLLYRTITSMRYRSLSPHTMSLMYEFFFVNND
jgi:hypothetical protein